MLMKDMRNRRKMKGVEDSAIYEILKRLVDYITERSRLFPFKQIKDQPSAIIQDLKLRNNLRSKSASCPSEYFLINLIYNTNIPNVNDLVVQNISSSLSNWIHLIRSNHLEDK